jgi:hypothetical protein
MLGITDDRQGMEDYVHFFRVLGYLLGIEDRFNLCAETLDETVDRCKAVTEQLFVPGLQVESEGFKKMAKDIADGLWHVNPALNHEVFIYFVKRLSGVPGFTYWNSENEDGQPSKELKKLGLKSRITLFILAVRLEILMTFRVLRAYFNFMLRVDRVINHYFPWLAMISYGVKKAYVRIF